MMNVVMLHAWYFTFAFKTYKLYDITEQPISISSNQLVISNQILVLLLICN